MPNPPHPHPQRDFRCVHCHGLIRIPADLPPTTGPCPHCKQTITSPAPGDVGTDTLSPDGADAHSLWTKGPKIGGNDAQRAEVEQQKIKRSHTAALAGACAVLLAVVAGGLLALREKKKPPVIVQDEALAESAAAQEAYYIQAGWKKDAYEVLDQFLKAPSAEEKSIHVLRADEVLGTMRDFYGNRPIDDSDTPATAFSAYNLSEADRKRGLFMLVFDQPPQFNLREFFRPLAPLEVQYGLTEADLLLGSMARVSNFTIDPLRVHAFFRKTDNGLKLDWEIFAQTKYRQLSQFLETPRTGATRTVRVFIMEDVRHAHPSTGSSRTYRIADPANTDHSARIVVPNESEVGRALVPIQWVGSEEKEPQSRTATVELEWTESDNQPQLAIRRFLCWEFLGLGGGMPAPDDSKETTQ